MANKRITIGLSITIICTIINICLFEIGSLTAKLMIFPGMVFSCMGAFIIIDELGKESEGGQ